MTWLLNGVYLPHSTRYTPAMPEPGRSVPNRAVDTQAAGDVLTVTVRKEFDAGNVHQDWAQQVQIMHPGPYAKVVFDLSPCGLLSSTFFAGLMQLHGFYGTQGPTVIVLHHPDPRVVRNLKILRLDRFMTIEPRPAA